MDKLIGKMLDNRYEVLEVIGTGGMAIVYKAKCHRLNRFVAVKVMKDEYARDEEFRRRFFDESQAVAMLSHPNIVSVYDVSRSGDVDYIVMELIDGITLKEYLVKRGPLSWRETTFFALQIAKALEHAHSRDIIHRDIKPQNIMLLRDGTVKVADFGIAHHATSTADYSKGEAIGSVHYVSPEQARGSTIDNRSDLYSFGVVMYEMLTGRLPFEGNTPMDVAIQHINSIPLMPSDYVDGIPQALEAITMKAMNPTPSKRYSSATEMIADLEKFRNDPTIDIEIDNAMFIPMGKASSNDVDATRKIANTGQLEARSEVHFDPTVLDADEAIDERRRRRSGFVLSPLAVALAAVLLFILGTVYFVFKVVNPFDVEDEKLQVPSLVGKELAKITAGGDEYSSFRITVSEEVYNEKIDKGIVISQSPDKGKIVTEGAEIKVVVSLGPKTVTVSDYENMYGRSVLVILDRLGLNATPQYEFSNDVESGLVIATSPGKDAVLNVGDSILVRISKGREVELTSVPKLMGSTLEQATAAITSAKLSLGTVTEVESETDEPGTVVFQSMPEGSKVDEGSVVNIQISKAPEPVPEPDPEPAPAPEPTPEPVEPNQPTQPTTPSEPTVPPAPKDVTIQYVVNIDDLDGEIQVIVAIDNKVSYTGNHTGDEGNVIVELTALEGSHSVTVFQNGRLTKEETVSFS